MGKGISAGKKNSRSYLSCRPWNCTVDFSNETMVRVRRIARSLLSARASRSGETRGTPLPRGCARIRRRISETRELLIAMPAARYVERQSGGKDGGDAEKRQRAPGSFDIRPLDPLRYPPSLSLPPDTLRGHPVALPSAPSVTTPIIGRYCVTGRVPRSRCHARRRIAARSRAGTRFPAAHWARARALSARLWNVKGTVSKNRGSPCFHRRESQKAEPTRASRELRGRSNRIDR